VVGVPDPRTGEHVCACVVLREGATLDVAGLAAHCLERGLAKMKCPEQVVVVDSIARNPMGKILKDQLRTQAAAVG